MKRTTTLPNKRQSVDEFLKTLAIEEHERTCHQDHTDRCAWFYEIHGGVHDWDRWTHDRFLKQTVENLKRSVDTLARLGERVGVPWDEIPAFVANLKSP